MDIIELNKRNAFVVTFTQALLGCITQNFRRVAISYEKPLTRLQFILEKENEEDQEEIDDAITDFEAMFGRDIEELEFETIVTNESMEILPYPPWLVVYQRKEEFTS